MRIVVTGSCGFIGRRFVQLAPGVDDIIDCIDMKMGYDIVEPSLIKSATERMEDYLYNADIVFNFAGDPHLPASNRDPYTHYRNNMLSAATVFRAARATKTKVIHASSWIAEYPVSSHYANSKWAAEMAAQIEVEKNQADIVVMRIFNVYGPGQPGNFAIPRFLDSVLSRTPITLHNDGSSKRDFIYIDDVVRAFLAAVDLPAGTIADVGSGTLTSMVELAEICRKMSPWGAPLTPIVFEPCPERANEPEGRAWPRVLDKVGWKPTVSLQDGVYQTLLSVTRNTEIRYESQELHSL